MVDENVQPNFIELATELTIAWLGNSHTLVSPDDIPDFLAKMHGALVGLEAVKADPEDASANAEYSPAVTARRSLASKDHIISMIDGKAYKMLKRHLSRNGLTPAEYRTRYGLKPDYPMVAENYAEMRRGLAKQLGLGRKSGGKHESKSAAKPKAATRKA